MSTTRSRLESRKPPKEVTRPCRRATTPSTRSNRPPASTISAPARNAPCANAKAPPSETATPTSESAFGCTRGWNRNGNARAMRSSKSWPRRAFSMAGAPPREGRASAALRGGLFAPARGGIHELRLLGDVGQLRELASELGFVDPAAAPREAAIETGRLGGIVVHGGPPKGAQRSKLTLTSGFG